MIDDSMDALGWLGEQLETDDISLFREMVRSFAQDLLSTTLTQSWVSPGSNVVS